MYNSTEDYISEETRATIRDFLGFLDLIELSSETKKMIREKFLNSINRFSRNIKNQFSPIITSLIDIERRYGANKGKF